MRTLPITFARTKAPGLFHSGEVNTDGPTTPGISPSRLIDLTNFVGLNCPHGAVWDTYLGLHLLSSRHSLHLALHASVLSKGRLLVYGGLAIRDHHGADITHYHWWSSPGASYLLETPRSALLRFILSGDTFDLLGVAGVAGNQREYDGKNG